MKKLLSVLLSVSTLAMAAPVAASAEDVQLENTVELLEATTAAEKTADTRDPNSKLSDGVKKAISEGKENISVYLIFKYNAEEISNEAKKRAEKEISELDQSEYNEKVIYAIKSKYLKEVNNEYINSILNEIGTDISQTQNKGWLTCTLDQEQINAAEANEKILGIFLDDPNYYLPLSDPLIYKETSESDKGDANLDGQVNIADAVLVIQVATNPDKYAQGKSEFSITAQGEINADVDGKAGLSNEDALLIQKFKLGLFNKL